VARLLGKSTRQVRRLLRKLQAGGDAALVHRLRGRPSNHRPDPRQRRAILDAYRQRYADFGPTFASENKGRGGPARLSPDAASLAGRRRAVATTPPS
jgi:hypothetical protein